MDTNNDYSVLMTVYEGETANNLDEAIKSIMEQTVVTNDFVIICDGELTTELNKILDKYKCQYGNTINIVRCKKRDIWADVLNEGLRICKNELVARMDSDDISVRNRCEKQLEVLMEDESIDVISCGIGEFFDDENQILSKRILPSRKKGLTKFAKYRCPLNHATVIYKKSAILRVGGYEYYPAYEDYQLWIKMINTGNVLENIDDVLYLMRAGEDLYRRRGGKQYLRNMIKFKRWMRDQGQLTLFQYNFSLIANSIVVLMPSRLRKWVYCSLLRK